VRTVYLGSSEFAAYVLAELAGTAHRPALVVTRPQRPSGRGRRPTPTPVARQAAELGLDLYEPARVNDPEARERIAAVGPDLLVVCAYGALIRQELLDAHTILNVHPSLLPRWRGAAPIERALIAGDRYTGVSLMRLTAGLDSGPVCARTVEPIADDDSYGTLAQRLQRSGAELLVAALERLAGGGGLDYVEQPDQGVTYAEKLEAADRLLAPTLSVAEAERRVRALHPHVGAVVEVPDGSTLGVLRAKLAGPPPALAPGTLYAERGRPHLALGDGALELVEVKPPGGRAMDGAAYLRGHPLPTL